MTLLENVTSLEGKLTVTDRTSWLVLNLNDHTISRCLTEATESGKVTVYDNTASNCCDDFMAMTYPGDTCKLRLEELSTDSYIGFAFEYNAEGTIAEGLGDKAETLANCFTNEAGSAVQIKAVDGSISYASAPTDSSKAAVYYQNEWHYYDTFAQAWATANAWNKENCTFRLLADWIADENGRIFYLDRYDSNFNMTIENGTLRGANAEEDGGAIWVDDEDVNLCLENLTITDNCAKDNGGALWVKNCNSVVFTDVDIEWNFCSKNSNDVGAAVLKKGDFYLYGTVNINMNYGKALQNETSGQNKLVLGDWLESAGVSKDSSIHLTDLTTATYEINGTTKGYRRISGKSETVNPDDGIPFTKDAFSLDYELTNRGYYEIVYKCTVSNTFHWFLHYECEGAWTIVDEASPS